MRYPQGSGPQTPVDWILFLGIPIGMLVVILWNVFEDYNVFKTFPIWFSLSWIVLLPIHELGHALMGKALGWDVKQLVIGFGPTWKRMTWGQTEIELRAVPLEGFVLARPRDAARPRLKRALVYFAGPGIELALLPLILLFVPFATVITLSEQLGIVVLQAFCMAILVSVFVNLFPHAAETQNGWVPNDGLAILQSFTWPLEAIVAGAPEPFDESRRPEDESDW